MSLAVKRFNVVKNILNKSMFDENIIHMILKYYWKLLDNKRKVLLPWIDNEYLYCYGIYFNLNAIELLKNNQDKINWNILSHNLNGIELLKIRIEYENSLSYEEYDYLQYKIDWDNLCLNPNAIDLLKNNQDEIDWYYLSTNPSIFEDEPMPIV